VSRKRRLSEEDLDLWQRVTAKTDALPQRDVFQPLVPSSPPAPRPQIFQPDIALDGKTPPKPHKKLSSTDLAPSLPDQLRQAPLQMDKKQFGRMTKGKLKPEARVDLHGMTLDRAHGVLTQFILKSHASGKRLVLVITGKGKHRDDGGPIPVRFGVLRHQVPQWLAQAPLASVVMQVSQAHVSHGGGGAYYVYLRRQR